ncbi:MAG TPA: hypothetical protein VMV86_01045 [Methanosarcinales archaeon]|nr:hypothetical protein [Methanosarcinales archaeon]
MRSIKERVAERIEQMPRRFMRATYKKALTGRSLRAAISSQCLECVGWQIDEVRKCTDLACPLFAVRPYKEDN